MPDQMVFLGPGILSTTDNESWKNQRDHFAPPFLPLSSIAEVSKTSIARAEWANDKLAEEAAGGAVVNINEFLLHEAMAQLCIGLFGLPTDMVEENNRKIRDAFGAVLEATGGSGGGMRPMNEGLKSVGKSAGFLFGFLGEFLDFVETATEEGAKLGPLGARM
jgi:cytochrome P450